MKLPNAAVLSRTAIVRSHHADSRLKGSCRPVEFRADAAHPRGAAAADYVTTERLISLKATHRISVQLAVAKSG